MAKTTNRPSMRPPTRAVPVSPAVTAAAVIPANIGRNQDQDAMKAALGVELKQPVALPATPVGAGVTENVGFAAAQLAQEGVQFVVGQNYLIPLHKLTRSENNARLFHDPIEVDSMSQSLRTKGQDMPAIGYVRDGRIVLTDGQKRFLAAQSAGLEVLEVKIAPSPETAADEYERSRRVNLERSTQTVIDDAIAWKNLLAREVYKSQSELAQRMGLEEGTVSKIMGINRIPERLLRMMLGNPQTRQLSHAYPISTLFDAQKVALLGGQDRAEIVAQEIIEEVAKLGLSRNQLEQLIAKRLEGKKTRAQAVTTQVKFGGVQGDLKVFPTKGQLSLSFRNLPEEKATELAKIIESALAGQLTLAG